jgi:hypothetical protein
MNAPPVHRARPPFDLGLLPTAHIPHGGIADAETTPAPGGSSSDVGGHLAVESPSRNPSPTPHEDWPTFRLTHSLRGRVSHWPLHACVTPFVRSGTNNLDIKPLAPIIPGRGT